MTTNEFFTIAALPLIPILALMLEINRRTAKRTWRDQVVVLGNALLTSLKAEKWHWIAVVCVFALWRATMIFFWPNPDSFDARQATSSELAIVPLGLILLLSWFAGFIYAGVCTLNRVAESLTPGSKSN